MELETYSQIKTSVKRLLNIDLTYYKDEQMRRRLDSWLVRSGAPDWDDYFDRLRGDQHELSRFRDYLTINVSEFFRDLERWMALRGQVMPALLEQARKVHPLRPALRVWSAGCSIGAEIYSLAIMLDEMAPGSTHYLLATDLDRGVLLKARAHGPYSVDEIRNVNPQQRATYFEQTGAQYMLKDSLARRITFKEHNLLNDLYENAFDLIVCRNVIIYFTTEAKAELYKKFYQALRPGGILFLGGTEIIPRPGDIGFQNVGISFYRKGGQ
ncbi:MAG: protein-glutamate O-methyltransferase CheR [Chloroflexi bacterium]|jgi:chemotaxis protein methyltransferase CheR|nr:protein-glutamate O-methyltransferase CheR [Anaerolineaceae bacterium]NMB86833.1 protein-glutamate O-methyltransferase CheR [Chloroflexota bacterium]